MCGICGVIARTPIGPEDERRALQINRALRHRGTDGEGTHRSEHTQFCMRRSGTIDLQSRSKREWRNWSLLDATPAEGDPVSAVRQARARDMQFPRIESCFTNWHSSFREQSRAGAEAISMMMAPSGDYQWLPFEVLLPEEWCREMEPMLTS